MFHAVPFEPVTPNYQHAGVSYRTAQNAAKTSLHDFLSACGVNDDGETLDNLQDLRGFQAAVEESYASAGEAIRAELNESGWALPASASASDVGFAVMELFGELKDKIEIDELT